MLKQGTRVKLIRFWNGECVIPAQWGTLMEDIMPWMDDVVVEIDPIFRDPDPRALDDGIREVPLKQIEWPWKLSC